MQKKITLLFIFCLSFLPVFSQTYPVHLTTQIAAPFSGYLADYTNPGEEKLKIIALFTDFSKPNYNVKLKISVQGQGINIQSKSFYFEGPFNLQPGVPIEISGGELAGLLNSQNLDFSGISKSNYDQHKVLPEGFYTICITAYDYNNPLPIQVSNNSCAQAWMVLSDPPFLNLPQCGSTVTVTNPQQLTFSFTQMNMGSPNSAANTEYVFELWEVRPQNAVPNNIAQTVPPIYSYTTNLTVINFGITEPPLLKGMQYAWRVRAIDITGRDLFKNQGYSQVCTFTYGNIFDGANVNLNLHGQGISQRQIRLWWDSLSTFSSYNLEFRKAGSNGNWYPATTSNNSMRILDLEPQTTYEVHVQGLSNDYTSPFSQIINVSTLPFPDYKCGEMPVPPNSAQFQPLTAANVNMIWQVGQFEMTITSLQSAVNSQGMYSGMGRITMPYGAKTMCRFTNVLVNSDQVVVRGKVVALTQSVDTWVDQTSGVGSIQDGTTDPEVQLGTAITTGDIQVNSQNGTYTVGGNTYTYTPDGSTMEDANGNLFIVTADGQVINVGTAGNGHGPVPESRNIINTSRGVVAFKANASQLYGLDEYKYAELMNYYLKVKNVTDNTHLPVNWKSVMAQKYDVIDLDYQLNSGLKTDSILFITGTGTVFKPQGSGNQRKLYFIGGKHGDVQELFACYKVKKDSFVNIAKINIVSYRKEEIKVTLVPLGTGIILDKVQIQKQLNDIYKQSVANWTVDLAPAITVADTLWDKDGNGRLNIGSNLFNRYSTELKALNKYLRGQSYYNSREYYLIVTGKPVDSLNTDIAGEMPRGRNIGYLFTSNPSAQLIAHELGHGAFALEHSFDGNATLPKGATACLMDYNHGSELYKGKYWDYVHNPVTVVGILDPDEAAASAVTNASVYSWLDKIKLAYKNGTTFTVPKASNTNAVTNLTTPTSVFLAGIQYDFIHVAVYASSLSALQVNCRNKITTGTFVKTDINGQPAGSPVSCLDIDGGVIKIEVPQNRLLNMQYYLQGLMTGKNLLLFVNGYRSSDPNPVEYSKGPDEISTGDLYNYWTGIDASFINQIGTRNVAYADGHHSIVTSNHNVSNDAALSEASFVTAMLNSNDQKKNCNSSTGAGCSDLSATFLHTTANTTGFSTRKACGMNAGNDLVSKINTGAVTFNKAADTLDIVCHSMGYAYALGMIQTLKIAGIRFGRFYIIAPENASCGQVPAGFEEVWQYGTNESRDFAHLQDGVAPQVGAKGLAASQRAYIPNDGSVPMGFVESHSIGNYKWIFKRKINDPGYVRPRN